MGKGGGGRQVQGLTIAEDEPLQRDPGLVLWGQEEELVEVAEGGALRWWRVEVGGCVKSVKLYE